MKRAALVLALFTALIVVVLVRSDVFSGWAQQNRYDRIQARTQAQAEWQLRQAERAAVSEAWVSGWRFAIPVFWGLVSFILVLIGGAACLVLIRLAMVMGPRPAARVEPGVRILEQPQTAITVRGVDTRSDERMTRIGSV